MKHDAADPDYAIDVDGLGVQYSLRLTRKTTIRDTFKNLTRRNDGPTHFWALRDVCSPSGTGRSAS